ncbi:MAG: hypothetical protein HYZ14_05625 [Bacteroidetes bacterium]|nr:hypothetical protein [Bacteroidota bacterium]
MPADNNKECITITLTLAENTNQQISLLPEELVSAERHAENPAYTLIHCTTRQHFMIRETLSEITAQLEAIANHS